MLRLPLLDSRLRTRKKDKHVQVWDVVRRQWVVLTPEEHVRQSLIGFLADQMQYPVALMAVEKGINFNHVTLRFDLVVYHRNTTAPWMLVECKSPEIAITDEVLQQLLQYRSKLDACRYWLLTNGHQTFCADAENSLQVRWLDALPAY
jgi:hypothetical protein